MPQVLNSAPPLLARIGASGDAREPHLHFEVTTSSKLLAGEGVPYLIDRYGCMSANGGPIELRIHELPLNKNVVAFGEDHGKKGDAKQAGRQHDSDRVTGCPYTVW
jgi:hypothetical protein